MLQTAKAQSANNQSPVLVPVMKKIMVINEGTAESKHATEFALAMAGKIKAEILLANRCRIAEPAEQMPPEPSFSYADDFFPGEPLTNWQLDYGFTPPIPEFDATGLSEVQLAEYICQNNIGMVIAGKHCGPSSGPLLKNLNINLIISKVRCPVLLIPVKWHIKDIERITYVSDLRYTCNKVISAVASFAKDCHAEVSLAHISHDGLPKMDEIYAESTDKTIISGISYTKFIFSNLKGKRLATAVDILTKGFKNDLLILINRSCHFEKIIGKNIPHSLPENLTIPLLIYPY